jgi:hypothetical protein
MLHMLMGKKSAKSYAHNAARVLKTNLRFLPPSPRNTNQSTMTHQLPRWILYLYTSANEHACVGGSRLLEEAEGHAEGSSLQL